MLASILRALMLRRLFEGSRRSRGYGSGYGRRSRRSSGGFGMWGPLPSYSRRTRRGSRVTVTGCCLPIPLGILLTPVAAYGMRRRASSR
jgi:hypothetical protein